MIRLIQLFIANKCSTLDKLSDALKYYLARKTIECMLALSFEFV